MRKYKKILSLAVVCMMFITSAVPSYAVSSSAEILNDLGLLANITDEELDAGLTRDVGVTMILKSLGYTQENADPAAGNGQFTDVTDWAVGWAELAYLTGITTGVDGTSFNPKGVLTKKEFVVFQLRALGYDKNGAWDHAIEWGVSAGLIDVDEGLVDANFTKGEAAQVMYNALSSTMYGTSKLLVTYLIDQGLVSSAKAEAYKLINSDFVVETVTSDNLKIISLVLSQNVDENSLNGASVNLLEDGEEYDYDDDYLDGVSAKEYAIHLVDDKQVDIVFGSAQAQGASFVVEVEGLLDTDGDTVTSFSRTVVMKDQMAPYAISAQLLNPIYVQIDYSEPLQTKTGEIDFEDVLIDGETFTGTLSLSNDSQTVYIEFEDALDEGTYEISLSGFSDFAGYVSSEQSFDLEAVEDNSPPYIVSAYAPNRNEVIVEFNEIIVEDEGEINIGDDRYELDDDDDEDYLTIYDNTVKITLKNPLSTSAGTIGVTGTYEDFEDMLGNDMGSETDFTFKAVNDSTPPTLEAYVDEYNAIIITFSEEVQAFDEDYFEITEYDEDEDEDVSIEVSSIRSYNSSDTTYIIELEDPEVNGPEYDLTIMGIRDISVYQNRLATVEMTLQMKDFNKPEVEAVKYLGDDLLRITFSEAMDPERLSDPSYYTYYDEKSDKTFELEYYIDYEITIDSDYEYVDIEIEDLDEDDRIKIGRLTDANGQVLLDYGTIYSFDDVEEFDYQDVEFRLIDEETIKIIADDHDFDFISPEDFLIRTGSSESETHYIKKAYIDEDDSDIAYLILSDDMDGDAEVNGKSQYIYMNDDATSKDTFNQVLDISYSKAVILQDYFRPIIDLDDSETETLIIEFNETVGTDSEDDLLDDILLKDEDGDYVNLTISSSSVKLSGGNGSYSFFDTIEINNLTAGEVYTIEVLSHNILDGNGNRTQKLSATEVTIED